MEIKEYHELRDTIDKLVKNSNGECSDLDGWFAYHCIQKDKEIKALNTKIADLYFEINKLKEPK